MSFEVKFKEIHQRLKAVVDAPCANEKDQETHDRLARYDYLHQKAGHTLMCACRQVFGGHPCECGTTPPQENIQL